MKTMKMIFSVMMILAVSPVAFAAEGDVHEKIVPVSDVYIPSGFDSASDAFVVVNGLFPNSCYSVKDAKVDHVGPALHEIRTFANVTDGMCLMVLVPFHKEVQIGKLGVGEHKLHFMNGDGTYMEKRLTIEQ